MFCGGYCCSHIISNLRKSASQALIIEIESAIGHCEQSIARSSAKPYCGMFKYAKPSMIRSGSIRKIVNTPPELRTLVVIKGTPDTQAVTGSDYTGYLLVLAATWMPTFISAWNVMSCCTTCSCCNTCFSNSGCARGHLSLCKAATASSSACIRCERLQQCKQWLCSQ